MKYSIFISVLIFVSFYSCKNDDNSKGFPSITTSSNISITDEGVVVNAEIQDNVFFEIIDHGFVFSLAKNANEVDNYNQISLGALSSESFFSTQIDHNLRNGESYVVKAYVQTKEKMIYGNSVIFVSKGSKSPVIKSFYPEIAYIGDTVTIQGEYFADINQDNTVYFGKNKSVLVSSNSNILKVIVPMLSESASAQLAIEVAGKTTLSTKIFNLGIPLVYAYTPEKVLPLEKVKMKGKGLLLVSKITIDGTIHYITEVTDSTAQFVLSNVIMKGKRTLELTQLDRIVSIDKQLEVIFPEIISVSPLIAWLDTVVTIRGTHLDKLENVSVNYEMMEKVFTSDSLLKIRINKVFNSGQIHGKFQYSDIISGDKIEFNPPIISKITPTVATYGDIIQLSGDRFFPELMSSIGQFNYLSKSEATIVVPWTLPAGSTNVELSYLVNYPANSVLFTIPEVQITEVFPYEIERGSIITIKADNLPKSHFPNYLGCNLDNHYLDIIDVSNGAIQVLVSKNTTCSEQPVLSLVVGMQKKTLMGALHFTEIWQKVDHIISLNWNSLFVSTENEQYIFNLSISNSSIKQFDLNLEQWSFMTNVPNLEFCYPLMAFNLGTDLFFVGYNDSQEGSIYKYSLSEKNWVQIKDFPDRIWGGSHPYHFIIEGKAYMGSNKGFYKYDQDNDSWIKKANLPTSRYEIRNPISFSLDKKGYVGFATDIIGSSEMNEFWEYDIETDSWKDLGMLPFSIHSGGTAKVYNGKAYLAGKSYNSGDKLMEFDPTTYHFKEMLLPPGYLSSNCYIFFKNDYFYFGSIGDNNNWMYKIPLSDLPEIYK